MYEFPKTIQVRVVTPAEEYLLTVRGDTNRKLLDKDRATTFHHSVAQLLSVTPRVRKDNQTAVSFLTSRFRIPYEYDWQKLRRVLQYIGSAIHMPLIPRLDNLNIVKWWVDTSYAMHPYFWIHNGATMFLGKI